jgi:hypothetical protein
MMTVSRQKSIEIKRYRNPTKEQLYEIHYGPAGLPVILEDASSSWRAISAWNLEFFRSRYSNETVAPSSKQYSRSVKIMKLSDYLNFVEDPLIKTKGFWLDLDSMLPRDETPTDTESLLYLSNWNIFPSHPELLEDVSPDPECIDDHLRLFPEDLQATLLKSAYNSRSILIGPAGSSSALHYDFLGTHAYIAQIQGSKSCTLFSPTDSHYLYDGQVDPQNVNLAQYPLFANAQAYSCVLNAGEVLLISSGWWHCIRNLESSIAVNYNFFNRTNRELFFKELSRVLPELKRQMSEHAPCFPT